MFFTWFHNFLISVVNLIYQETPAWVGWLHDLLGCVNGA